MPVELTRAAIPADNPQTPEKIVLGQKLFFDRRLSADGTVGPRAYQAVLEGSAGRKQVIRFWPFPTEPQIRHSLEALSQKREQPSVLKWQLKTPRSRNSRQD